MSLMPALAEQIVASPLRMPVQMQMQMQMHVHVPVPALALVPTLSRQHAATLIAARVRWTII